MPRTSRLALLVAVLALPVIGGGCTATGPSHSAVSSAPAQPEGRDPAAWVDALCGSMLASTRSILVRPDFGAAPDLAGVQETFSGYLGGVVAAQQQSRAELATVGPAPVPVGTEIVFRLDGGLRRVEKQFADAKEALDTADPDDPDAFLDVLTELEGAIGVADVPDVLAEFADDPLLDQAAAEAANCRELDQLPTSAPG